MNAAEELRSLTESLRDLVMWDADDKLPGYVPGPPPPGWKAPRKPQPARAQQPAPQRTQQRPQQERHEQRPGPAQPRPPQPAAPPVPTGPPATTLENPTLPGIAAELGDCQRCKLSGLGRKNIVFGEGSPTADLLFIGEGPGFHEDALGRPFVGRGGELLDKMIGAMGLSRDTVYICNVVKCRPPKNRDPEADEIAMCDPFLKAQIRSIKPKVIVTLGAFASQSILESNTPIGQLRGQFAEKFGAKVMPTFHPAYLLRSPQEKGKAWADLQLVMAELGLTRPTR
ncbi:MAG: uracil-DNA glycosylase family 4 [Myxococcota bacterium]|jgi:uracil-DNA glycosylase family 4